MGDLPKNVRDLISRYGNQQHCYGEDSAADRSASTLRRDEEACERIRADLEVAILALATPALSLGAAADLAERVGALEAMVRDLAECEPLMVGGVDHGACDRTPCVFCRARSVLASPASPPVPGGGDARKETT